MNAQLKISPAHPSLAEHILDLPVLGERPNAPAAERAVPARPWLITIVDLMTILLTFFVLLFSMAKIDMVRFIPVARSYADAFAGAPPADAAPRLPEVAAPPGDNLSYLEAVLRPAFARHASLADVQFHATPQYLILSWPHGADGSSDAARRRVFDLGGALSNLHNRIAVVGEVAGPPDEESWRSAIARANAVADAIARAGYDKEITVLGRSVAPGSTAAGAADQLRILIMPEQPAS